MCCFLKKKRLAEAHMNYLYSKTSTIHSSTQKRVVSPCQSHRHDRLSTKPSWSHGLLTKFWEEIDIALSILWMPYDLDQEKQLASSLSTATAKSPNTQTVLQDTTNTAWSEVSDMNIGRVCATDQAKML